MWSGGDAEPTVSTQTAGASRATADTASTCAGQCCKNTRRLGGQDLHGICRAGFPREAASLCPLHTQLTVRPRVEGPREVYHRGSPGPGRTTATPTPAATVPWPPTPAWSTPQPRTRSGTVTAEKRMRSWAAAEGSHGGAQVHRDGMDFTCFSTHLLWGRAHTQGQWSLIQPDARGFHPSNGGADRARWAMEQRGGPTAHPRQALDTPHHQPQPHQGDDHTLKKDAAGIHTQNSPHTKNTRHTLSRNAFLRPQ